MEGISKLFLTVLFQNSLGDALSNMTLNSFLFIHFQDLVDFVLILSMVRSRSGTKILGLFHELLISEYMKSLSYQFFQL